MRGFLHRLLEFVSTAAKDRRARPCATAAECRRIASWAKDKGWKRVESRWTARAKRWQSECDRLGGKDPC